MNKQAGASCANSDPTQVWNGPDVISGGARFCRENFRRRSFLPRKRPSLGHGFLLLLLIETDYNANSQNSQYPEYSNLFNGSIYEQKKIVNIMEEREDNYQKLTQRSTEEP